jgi:chromosome segregation ATPase
MRVQEVERRLPAKPIVVDAMADTLPELPDPEPCGCDEVEAIRADRSRWIQRAQAAEGQARVCREDAEHNATRAEKAEAANAQLRDDCETLRGQLRQARERVSEAVEDERRHGAEAERLRVQLEIANAELTQGRPVVVGAEPWPEGSFPWLEQRLRQV